MGPICAEQLCDSFCDSSEANPGHWTLIGIAQIDGAQRPPAAPLPRFVQGRVALLGDSAHATTPDLGQGACQALEDSVVIRGRFEGGRKGGAWAARIRTPADGRLGTLA